MRQKPVIVRTPYPTTEEVAEVLGVSKKRLRELRRLVGFEPQEKKKSSPQLALKKRRRSSG